MPSDLDYFFRYLQVIRDRSNAVICCGTSYVVRRRALEDIGGYVTSCLIEDHQTSTKLLTRGWTIRYLNEVLSMGEVPAAQSLTFSISDCAGCRAISRFSSGQKNCRSGQP